MLPTETAGRVWTGRRRGSGLGYCCFWVWRAWCFVGVGRRRRRSRRWRACGALRVAPLRESGCWMGVWHWFVWIVCGWKVFVCRVCLNGLWFGRGCWSWICWISGVPDAPMQGARQQGAESCFDSAAAGVKGNQSNPNPGYQDSTTTTTILSLWHYTE